METHIFFTQLNTEASIDPWNNADFVNKTAGKQGTYGDLMDRSAELSAQRASQNGGVDPVKEKYYKNYSKNQKRCKASRSDEKKF